MKCLVVLIGLICLWCTLPVSQAAVEMVRAPNFGAEAVDQLDHSKQACGPASLLNQLRFGNATLQSAEGKIPAEGDARKLRWIIGRYGIKGSNHLSGRMRWNQATGVNVADLEDMANLMAGELRSSKVTTEHLQRKKGDRGQELISRAHKRIVKSLKSGVPPILQVRRVVHRQSTQAQQKFWMGVHGHFVVIIGVQKKLAKNSSQLLVEYVDPWRGSKFSGYLEIPTEKFFATNPSSKDGNGFSVTPYLNVNFPSSSIGESKIRAGEKSVLTCPNLIGRF